MPAPGSRRREAEDTGWIPVVSSNVAFIRFIRRPYAGDFIMVRFKSGGGGVYSGVRKELFTRFRNSPSKGQFVHRVLTSYQYTRGGV